MVYWYLFYVIIYLLPYVYQKCNILYQAYINVKFIHITKTATYVKYALTIQVIVYICNLFLSQQEMWGWREVISFSIKWGHYRHLQPKQGVSHNYTFILPYLQLNTTSKYLTVFWHGSPNTNSWAQTEHCCKPLHLKELSLLWWAANRVNINFIVIHTLDITSNFTIPGDYLKWLWGIAAKLPSMGAPIVAQRRHRQSTVQSLMDGYHGAKRTHQVQLLELTHSHVDQLTYWVIWKIEITCHMCTYQKCYFLENNPWADWFTTWVLLYIE